MFVHVFACIYIYIFDMFVVYLHISEFLSFLPPFLMVKCFIFGDQGIRMESELVTRMTWQIILHQLEVMRGAVCCRLVPQPRQNGLGPKGRGKGSCRRCPQKA